MCSVYKQKTDHCTFQWKCLFYPFRSVQCLKISFFYSFCNIPDYIVSRVPFNGMFMCKYMAVICNYDLNATTVYLFKLDTLFFFNNSTNTHRRQMKPFAMCFYSPVWYFNFCHLFTLLSTLTYYIESKESVYLKKSAKR